MWVLKIQKKNQVCIKNTLQKKQNYLKKSKKRTILTITKWAKQKCQVPILWAKFKTYVFKHLTKICELYKILILAIIIESICIW